ncbi:MAG: polysulfide reductase NrfD [Halobacteriovoraceae bacterium]|nr:polysulfide reductase NrfD [Halobacteriovoraceae bacterium]
MYFKWIGILLFITFAGLVSYIQQLDQGLVVTNLTDEVSWGAYIANFTFLVGVAAAAVLLVIPAYVYKNKAVKEVVLIGEILAFCAIVMCLLFIMVDMGRPDRFWHVIPFLGRLNFPQSILAWDVIVLNGYLVLNMHIPGYLLYKYYMGQKPTTKYYLPFVFISIFWAVSIHTVTAFLYSGLGGRGFWNSAILAPRFLVSAFAAGPLLLMVVFFAINKWYPNFRVKEEVFTLLKKIATFAFPLNLFLLFCEVFKEFYTDSVHVASAEYLFFGLHGNHMLVPYMWMAVFCSVGTAVVFLVPKFRDNKKILIPTCFVGFIGIWIEKGMGLIIPGFIPSPLGSIVEYTPSVNEIFVCLGIWSFGALLFTVMAKTALGILSGKIRHTN